jgi:dihydrofolate reductase
MRRVIWLMHMSLDGCHSGPDGGLDWIHLDDELWDDLEQLMQTVDAALYGRITYGMMETYWPTAAEQPNATRHDIAHATWVNAATKYVVSTTRKDVTWQNSRILVGPLRGEIESVKAATGKDVLMIGSPCLGRAMLAEGLIDELRLNLNPLILGRGLRLFDGTASPVSLKLRRAHTYRSGVVGLTYGRG